MRDRKQTQSCVCLLGTPTPELECVAGWAGGHGLCVVRLSSPEINEATPLEAIFTVIDAEAEPWDAILHTARLRATNAELPLLVLGPRPLSQPGFVKAMRNAGATEVLNRPIGERTLRDSLEGFYSRREATMETHLAPRLIRLSASSDLDLDGRCLRLGLRELPLTKGKFDLLAYLVSHPGRAVSAEELVRAGVLAPSQRTRYRAIVLELRDKLGDAKHSVRTVPGYGYRFDPPVLSDVKGDRSEPLAAPNIAGHRAEPRSQTWATSIEG